LLGNDIVVYISAASDLNHEREILGRIAAEIPVDTGWRIVLSPTGDGLLERESIQYADIHFLLLGGDIRAPIGQEWIMARQAGQQPIPYLKTGILRTSAAIDFSRYIKAQAVWKPFSSGAELRRNALLDIIDHILDNIVHYSLTLSTIEKLQTLGEKIKADTGKVDNTVQSGTGSSSVILSPETIASKGGVIVKKKN
jgi:hypothetical protein